MNNLETIVEFMELSTYKPNCAKEIEQLFVKTFADSEVQSEGEQIGRLVMGLMDSTDANDLYLLVCTKN